MSDIKGPFEVYENYSGGLSIIDSTTRVVLDDVYAYDGTADARDMRMAGIARALSIYYGADQQTARTSDEHDADRDRLAAECENLKEYIAASKEVAQAEDALWYAEEYERLRAGFEKMIKKFEADGGDLEFKMTGCEWCGAILPKCEGDSIDLVHQRVKRHIYSCEKHPLKIERDSLSSALSTLQQRCGEVERENRWLRERYEVHHPAAGSRPDDLTVAEERLIDVANATAKIKLDLSDPETREVWECVLEAKREVDSWPAWKRGDAAEKEKP